MISRQSSKPSSDWSQSASDDSQGSQSKKPRRRRSTKSKRKLNRRLAMEGLERRQLLAANSFGPIPNFDTFDGPRNVGTVAAFNYTEREGTSEIGENDSIFTAEAIPLGTGSGQRDTVDVFGTVGFEAGSAGGFVTDIDFYSFELVPGDILDIAAIGAVSSFTVFTPDGQVWLGQDGAEDPELDFISYPLESPLQTNGNVRLAQVAPFAGTYTIAVSAEGILANYTLGLRTYRPVTESLPIGQGQTVFLDFDGGVFPREEFNGVLPEPGLFNGGLFRVPPIAQTLEQAGVVAQPQQFNTVANGVIQTVISQFNDLENYTGNGSFRLTGNPGDFGITVLNSFEHAEPVGVPFTRVVFGSQAAFPEIVIGDGLLGIAQTVDVGNFDLSETVLVFVDNEVAFSETIPRSAALSEFDVLGLEIGVTTTHELAHVFGAYHTDGNNLTPSIIDGGGIFNAENGLGVGVDGILGTIDDVLVRFRTDFVDPGGAVTFGTLYSGESVAHVLSTGTQGGSISGRVFEDFNGNGSSAGDPGLAGVTVFLDTNANGVQDPTDPSAVTGANGSFSLAAAAGTFNLFAIPPNNFAATSNAVAQSVSVGASGIEFGFTQVNPDVTGRKFADLNNNGALDVGEPGIAGAYIYADLDGDNRPDLFEPFDITDANGFYTLELDVIGQTFAIREVEEPGFERTLPLSGEHIVTFTGGPLGSNFNFGGLPSRDFGDAPDSYQTTIASNGPSHGISDAVRIGASVDRELDGAPSVAANGDDTINVALNQIDDEDGVVLIRPPGANLAGQYAVSLTNTSGSQGYLQGWVDFNADGDFLDAGEQIVTDGIFGTGTAIVNFTLPAGFNINADGNSDGVLDTFSRFRYSTTPGLGVGGAADDGEVEDNVLRLNATGSLTAPDVFSVPQNAQSFPLNVLANDLSSPGNPLTILNAVSTNPVISERGIVTIGTGAGGQQVLLYTPSRDFTGRDTLVYSVAGQSTFETVEVNVTFQTAAPIAIDDIYEVPSTESNFPLNVLDNDIASVQGGLTIVSVTRGTQGGVLSLTPGQRGLRYSPASSFTGSEQFTYTIQDASGQISSATGTVVLTPQALLDDRAEFRIEILDQNNDTELLTLQAGQTFRVRVSVDDILRADGDQIQGLQSAFTDLLYTAELVTPVESNPNDAFPFDITFGPNFESGGFQLGNTLRPGIFDEVGSTQSSNNLGTVGDNPDLASHTGFAELFTITMRATGAGVALFQTDPSDAVVSETILIDSFEPLRFDEITYGSVDIPIVPAGDGFPVALDDSFPAGFDSLGQTISSLSVASFDVLTNDIIGPTDNVIEFGLREAPTSGNATIDTRGTADPSDDIINYTPVPGFQGFDQFSYILTVDSAEFGTVRSVANVTLVVGAIQNPQAQYEFTFVDPDTRQEITSVAAGERFGVQIDAIDISDSRNLNAVFAGFLDILYTSDIIETIAVDNGGNPNLFDFDVEFDPQFLLDPAVGSNDRPGLIDEFGSNQGDLGGSGLTLATVFFTALRPGLATVTGSPADRFPFQDTLLDLNDDAVPVDQIIYDSQSILVTSGSASPEPLHNADLPVDVNGDNLVTAIDALIVINQMARSRPEGEFASNSTGPSFFYDVNGDGHISAVDALRVINWLNRPNSGSSEPIALVEESSSEVDGEPLTQVTEELAAAAKVVGGIGDSETSNTASLVEVSSNDDSDDDDELFGLLADDIVNQWS